MDLISTRDGVKTLSYNKVYLHSKYSPLKEAEKFVKSNITTKNTLIILGAGLGYLFKAVKRKNPNVEIISIPYNKELGELSLELNPEPRIQWDMETPLQDFIKVNININNIKDLQVIEWQPASRAFPEVSSIFGQILIERIRKVNGNLMTTARFGKKWIQNSIKNFLNIDSYVTDIKVNKPVVIVASGKSLERSIELIKEIRNSITLISLTSANKALNSHEITPDISFSTDPGYYSKLHIYNNNQLIAMPLTNSTSNNNPVLLINQGNDFENEIIDLGCIPCIKLSENGTVAGSALDFALRYSKHPIYLIGQDLAPSDIQSHISPYAFDNLLKKDESKISPYYSIMFKRWINSGITYKTYRDWFSKTASKYPGRIYRVNSTTEDIPGIEDIKGKILLSQIPAESEENGLSIKIKNARPVANRQQCIEKILNNWIEKLKSEKIAQNPLFFLISTSKYTDVNNKALSPDEVEILETKGKDESIIFIKRLLKLYGRQLLQQ